MSKLWDVIEMALGDAGRAETLMGDPRTRQALRNDPERALQVFDLRAQEITESIAIRKARSGQRDLAVVTVRSQTAAGTRLPA
ncbi:MAG TPA: hypothetical protein VGR46_04920 [Candidatus Limnocylindria bacterium]|jgi:hypothetical protein|nr:hypothetical protein [Candidatus Limnocylindria bacterium]